MRQLFHENFQKSRNLIELNIKKFQPNIESDIAQLLVLVEKDSSGEYLRTTQLNLENVERYLSLTNKYSGLEKLYQYIITNAPTLSQLEQT